MHEFLTPNQQNLAEAKQHLEDLMAKFPVDVADGEVPVPVPPQLSLSAIRDQQSFGRAAEAIFEVSEAQAEVIAEAQKQAQALAKARAEAKAVQEKLAKPVAFLSALEAFVGRVGDEEKNPVNRAFASREQVLQAIDSLVVNTSELSAEDLAELTARVEAASGQNLTIEVAYKQLLIELMHQKFVDSLTNLIRDDYFYAVEVDPNLVIELVLMMTTELVPASVLLKWLADELGAWDERVEGAAQTDVEHDEPDEQMVTIDQLAVKAFEALALKSKRGQTRISADQRFFLAVLGLDEIAGTQLSVDDLAAAQRKNGCLGGQKISDLARKLGQQEVSISNAIYRVNALFRDAPSSDGVIARLSTSVVDRHDPNSDKVVFFSIQQMPGAPAHLAADEKSGGAADVPPAERTADQRKLDEWSDRIMRRLHLINEEGLDGKRVTGINPGSATNILFLLYEAGDNGLTYAQMQQEYEVLTGNNVLIGTLHTYMRSLKLALVSLGRESLVYKRTNSKTKHATFHLNYDEFRKGMRVEVLPQHTAQPSSAYEF